MCWPGANSQGIPEGKDLWPNKGDRDLEIVWGGLKPDATDPSIANWSKLKLADKIFEEVYANAAERAKEMCKIGCCPQIRVKFFWKPRNKPPIANPKNSQTDYDGSLTIQDYVWNCKTGTKSLVAR